MFERLKEKGIYWDRLWRLVDGCTPCSPGCGEIEKGGGCWVAREARVRSYGAKDLLSSDGRWNGQIRLRQDNLDLPIRVKKSRAWLILNDLFHPDVPFEFIESALGNMAISPRHIFLVLTKRPKRILDLYKFWEEKYYGYQMGKGFSYSNIWLGVTVCNQEELWKLDELQDIPAAIHWVSFEPLLEDLGWINLRHIEFAVLGGETGPRARPMHPDWPRRVRDGCKAAGVPFMFKQWGEWVPSYNDERKDNKEIPIMYRIGKKLAGRLLDGREWNELPEVR